MSAGVRHLVVTAAALLLGVSTLGCQLTAQQHGLPTDPPLHVLTASTSCRCCALCHVRPRCASLAFISAHQRCLLYPSVANYSAFRPFTGADYLLMSGNSWRDQFCRAEADCRHPGDRCRGHVCLAGADDTALTCLQLRRRGALHDGVYGGWIDGKTLPLWCNMTAGGFTQVLSSVGSGWTAENLLWRNGLGERRLENDHQPYSILQLANDIIGSNGDGFYELMVETHIGETRVLTEVFTAPVHESLPARFPTPLVNKVLSGDAPTNASPPKYVPWRPDEDGKLTWPGAPLLTMGEEWIQPDNVVVPPPSDRVRIDISVREAVQHAGASAARTEIKTEQRTETRTVQHTETRTAEHAGS